MTLENESFFTAAITAERSRSDTILACIENMDLYPHYIYKYVSASVEYNLIHPDPLLHFRRQRHLIAFSWKHWKPLFKVQFHLGLSCWMEQTRTINSSQWFQLIISTLMAKWEKWAVRLFGSQVCSPGFSVTFCSCDKHIEVAWKPLYVKLGA